MQITKEYLEARLLQLQEEERQAIAQANALHGAVTDIQQLLIVLAAPEPVIPEGELVPVGDGRTNGVPDTGADG